MSDPIERQAAKEAYCKKFCHPGVLCPDSGFCREVDEAFDSVPSAKPDIKQAAKLLSDFIESCPGGDSYLRTPDGEKLRTDWGYAMEGIQLIHDWAERRSDG